MIFWSERHAKLNLSGRFLLVLIRVGSLRDHNLSWHWMVIQCRCRWHACYHGNVPSHMGMHGQMIECRHLYVTVAHTYPSEYHSRMFGGWLATSQHCIQYCRTSSNAQSSGSAAEGHE